MNWYGIVYKITNKINGKCYIGQTVYDLKTRLRGHMTDAKRHNFLFGNALLKYGIENFDSEVICKVTSKTLLDDAEKFYIKLYDSKKPNGYNLLDGGSNSPPDEDTRKRISNTLKKLYSRKENCPMYGKRHSEETKRKISEARIGKKYPKLSAAKKGIPQSEETKRKRKELYSKKENNPMYGKHHSNDSKEKIALKKSKTWYFTDPDGNNIEIFNLKKFCKENSLDRCYMSKVSRGLLNQYRGWTRWNKLEE